MRYRGVNRKVPDETAARVTALGRRFIAIRADLGKQESIQSVVDTAVAEMGRIDILVNNAGTIRRADALEFNEKDWDEVIDLNLKSVFFLSQAVAKQFIAQGQGGKIINIASMLSFQGGIRVPSYGVKSGVLGLTRLLANEWAPLGIYVNAIAPVIWRPITPGSFAMMSSAAGRSSTGFRRAAGVSRRIYRVRWCFWLQEHLITLTVILSP